MQDNICDIRAADERRRIGAKVKEWLHTPTLLLRAGEMSAQEIRTVKAVLGAILFEIDGIVRPIE